MSNNNSEDSKSLAEIEKWKAAQQGIGLTEKAGSFLHQVFGQPLIELGGLLGDQVKIWRATNINNQAIKFEEIRKARGLHPEAIKHLPFGDAYRATEAMSVEENESVQTLWAELIASATDTDRNVEIKKVFIELLKSFSEVEAAFFNTLWDSRNPKLMARLQKDEVQSIIKEFEQRMGEVWNKFPRDVQQVAIQNLIRLNCIEIQKPKIELGWLAVPFTRSSSEPLAINATFVNQLKETLSDLDKSNRRGKAPELKFNYYTQPVLNDRKLTELVYLEVTSNYRFTSLGEDLMKACKSEQPVKPELKAAG